MHLNLKKLDQKALERLEIHKLVLTYERNLIYFFINLSSFINIYWEVYPNLILITHMKALHVWLYLILMWWEGNIEPLVPISWATIHQVICALITGTLNKEILTQFEAIVGSITEARWMDGRTSWCISKVGWQYIIK